MKKILFFALLLSQALYHAQAYNSLNISLVGLIAPNTSTLPSPVGNKYSGCWGWYQQAKSKEYAISGASNGTYFIDISNPSTPTVSAFVSGKTGCTWREVKSYKNYCYIASDDGVPNKFQIVDMQYLPDSVHIVHNSNSLFERGHTLWVDSNKLYVGGVTFSTGTSPMAIYSLATPSAPVLVKKLDSDIAPAIINYVHDMYARNDTIYASTGNTGLFVLHHNTTTNSLSILGSYTGYLGGGYNHSSMLTKNGKYLMFCDEVPSSLPIHMVDVQNLANIQPLSTFFPRPQTTAHNPYLIGNNFAVVSCYQDGLFIYDISQPQSIKQVGYFDTYPQGGFNTGSYGGSAYNGNWGAYPYLPSGLIVANDMQNGVLILNPAAAYTTTVKSNVDIVGLTNKQIREANLMVFPNPAHESVVIAYPVNAENHLEIRNSLGQLVYSTLVNGAVNETVNLSHYERGIYVISINNNYQRLIKKLEVLH